MVEVERRKHPRVPMVQTVRYRYESLDTFKERHISDLSYGGMFIATDEPDPVGTVIYIEFEAEGSRIFGAFGKVVRVNPPDAKDLDPGMGIEFLKLDEASAAALVSLLE